MAKLLNIEKNNSYKCICCDAVGSYSTVHVYNEKPAGETDFSFQKYFREIKCCANCGHFVSTTPLEISKLYQYDYVDRTYGDRQDIKRKFEQIMSLKPEESDNSGRVNRVIEYAKKHFSNSSKLSILDVGGGIGVFLALIKKRTNWDCMSIEPDNRLVEHTTKMDIGIESLSCDYRCLKWNLKFDIICLNKVLEHIEEPLSFLEKAKKDLKPNGFVYLELPDGESASLDTKKFNREEFFIEHHHAFSMKSMQLLSRKAGFKIEKSERLIEPSSKFTILSFLKL